MQGPRGVPVPGGAAPGGSAAGGSLPIGSASRSEEHGAAAPCVLPGLISVKPARRGGSCPALGLVVQPRLRAGTRASPGQWHKGSGGGWGGRSPRAAPATAGTPRGVCRSGLALAEGSRPGHSSWGQPEPLGTRAGG